MEAEIKTRIFDYFKENRGTLSIIGIYITGSRNHNCHQPTSDFDIVVLFKHRFVLQQSTQKPTFKFNFLIPAKEECDEPKNEDEPDGKKVKDVEIEVNCTGHSIFQLLSLFVHKNNYKLMEVLSAKSIYENEKFTPHLNRIRTEFFHRENALVFFDRWRRHANDKKTPTSTTSTSVSKNIKDNLLTLKFALICLNIFRGNGLVVNVFDSIGLGDGGLGQLEHMDKEEDEKVEDRLRRIIRDRGRLKEEEGATEKESDKGDNSESDCKFLNDLESRVVSCYEVEKTVRPLSLDQELKLNLLANEIMLVDLQLDLHLDDLKIETND